MRTALTNPIEQIRTNIAAFGYHTYIVLPGVCPRYSYTIGFTDTVGFELICGGMALFDSEDLRHIFFTVSKELVRKRSARQILDRTRGRFALRKVDNSWIEAAALGAVDFYKTRDLEFYQIFFEDLRTIDDPDMSYEIDHLVNGSWKYLIHEWPYQIHKESQALLDVDAVKGNKVRVISRYEDDYWEMSSNSDGEIDIATAKILPMSVLLEAYPDIRFATQMEKNTRIVLG